MSNTILNNDGGFDFVVPGPSSTVGVRTLGDASANFSVTGAGIMAAAASTIASLTVSGAATIGTTLGVTGAATLSSTLAAGASTLASLAVTAAATVGTTLGVTGAATLNSIVCTNGATVGTTLVVTGASTHNGGLAVAGAGTSTLVSIIQTAATSGTPAKSVAITGGAHTGANNAEIVDFQFGFNRTVTLTGGGSTIANMRSVLVSPPTYSAPSAQTITSAATMQIAGPPVAAGSITMTSAYALNVNSGNLRVGGGKILANLTAAASVGTCHIVDSSAGTSGATATAGSVGVFDRAGSCFVSMLGGATSPCTIYMGSTVSATRGAISYDHNTDILTVGSESTTGTFSIGSLATQKFGVFGTSPVAQQVSAANLTNSVTSGGTDNTVDNVVAASVDTSAAALVSTRNAIYQLARKLKQVNDALRLYGWLS